MTTAPVQRLTFGKSRRFAATAALGFGKFSTAAAALILLLPPFTIVLVSFSHTSYFQFPPEGLGFRHYDALFSDSYWLSSVATSCRIAIPAAIISALIAIPTVLALYRSRLRGGRPLQFAAMLPLIIPISAYAVAMWAVFAEFKLVATYLGLLLANVVLVFPFTLAVLVASMSRVPQEFELAAMIAGAGRVRAWVGITGRLLLPAILGGLLLAFIASFDEAVMIVFIGGPDQTTLAKAIFESIRTGVDPAVTAIATLLMIGTGALVFVIEWLRSRSPTERSS